MVIALPFYKMIKQADGSYQYGDEELNSIHLYPKNVVANDGSMKLTKTGTAENEKLNGAEFAIAKVEGGVAKYISGVKDGLYTWTTDLNAAKKFVTGNTYGIDNNDFTEATGNKGELIVNGLEVGHYQAIETKAPDNAEMIESEKVHDFEVSSESKTVEVKVKNDTSKVEKTTPELDGNSVNIGEKILYRISVNIPEGINDRNAEGSYVYTKFNLTDSHDEVLTLYDGGQTLLADGTAIDYTINPNTATGFTVVPNLDQLRQHAGATLTFTYYMYLNDKADPTQGFKNEANVDNGHTEDKTPPTIEVVTGGKRFVKVDGDVNSNNALAGAEFVVRNGNDDSAQYLQIDPTTKAATWVDTLAEATTFTTGKDGLIDITGLKYGTYYLEETKAPADYVQLTNRIEFEVNSSSYGSASELADPTKVPNKHKGLLPSTGGKGIVAFMIVGLVAVVSAIVYFIRGRKHA